MRPGALGCTRTMTVALAPTPMEPRLPMMTPPLVVQDPWDGTAETRLRLAGRELVKATPLAPPGPALVMVKVYISGSPACKGPGTAATVSPRSGSWLTGEMVVMARLQPLAMPPESPAAS